MTDTHFEELRFSSALEFLNTIRRSNTRLWGDDADCRWVFRGQGDADWALMPKVFRADLVPVILRCSRGSRETAAKNFGKLVNHGSHYFTPSSENRERVLDAVGHYVGCMELVRTFCRFASELGLINFDERYLYKFHKTVPQFISRDRDFPLSQLAPEAHLAQHYGLPTALLDWTYDPIKAAFFAAGSTHEESKLHDRDLAIWAVRTDLPTGSQHKASFVYGDPHANLRLRAQEGIHTWYQFQYVQFIETGKWAPHETVIAAQCGSDTRQYLRKLRLAASERTELTTLLWRERVSRMHLMPSLDSAADTTLWYLMHVT